MRLVSKALLIIIPTIIILAIFAINSPKESEIKENYQLGLSGIKKQYVKGEMIIFSLFLKGYGSECGTYDVQLKKGDTIIERKSIDIDCTETVGKDFEFVNIDITTLEWTLLEAGNYTAVGEFTKNDGQKFQDQKTFTVIE
ncbi:MAG TPA: hypothetical protein VMW55_02370 [Nitrosopumilaceae archaeon]|jgi:hypothetical protein|nr:hypothetical protein [Nitrosopumilaceae archaeon]